MSAEALAYLAAETEDTAGLIHTIVGELMIVDQRLKHLNGKANSADVLLIRRFVAMAAEAALIVEKTSAAPEQSSAAPRRLL
ncbi:MAG: hypothetical protein V4441_05985 [Pseudomonadota bacterium]